jgi:hypothetical protein
VDVMRGEMVEGELGRLIERRSRQKDPDEEHDLWRASERAYFARRDEEHCLERLTYHEGQAARLSGALGALVAHHRAEAEKYRALTEGEPQMTEGHEHSTRLGTLGLPYGTQAADEMLNALAEPSGADA